MLATEQTGYLKFQGDFHKVCEEFCEKIAITYYKKDESIEECSYIEMEKRVQEISCKYQKIGIARGDRVAVLIPLCTNAYLDILALAYMGVTSVILDINMKAVELARVLNDADVSCIITVRDLFEKKMQNVSVPVYDASDECQCLKDGIVNHAVDPDYDAIAILYSSGTTSNAKGVVIGYAQENDAMDYLLEVVGTTEIRYLMLFPNSHISGFTDFLVLLMRGGAIATIEDASAIQLVNVFHKYRPNTFGMVPKVWETFKKKIEDAIRARGDKKAKVIFSLITLGGFVRRWTGINVSRKYFKSINEEVFGGNLQSVHSGGGKANPEVMQFFWNLGYDCYDFYASTEANVPILVTSGKKFMTSVGNIYSNPNTSIRIWNPDANGIGEVQVKSNTMMKGYFRNDELTKSSFEGEYFKTGDYGKIVKNELYLTGRMKESIHLKNGEKVSPDDLEELYRTYLTADIEFAIVGIHEKDNYDSVCVCVVGEIGQHDKTFKLINDNVSSNNKYTRLVYVEMLPKTSVGKVKRFELQRMISENISLNSEAIARNELNISDRDMLQSFVTKLVENIVQKKVKTMDSELEKDLGFDSLAIFELCVEIENKTGVNIASYISPTASLELIVEIIIKHVNEKKLDYVDQFPKNKKWIDLIRFYLFCKLTKSLYDIEVHGLEYIDINENYIFAPNHESYLDGLWMLSVLPREFYNRICSMAEAGLFEKNIHRWGTLIMGGIPVDRAGNPTIATKRVLEVLKDGRHSLLIHPEGTRSRSGKLGKFKTGVAELAIKSRLKVIPVGINGAFNIYPPSQKLPKTGKNMNGKKYKLRISFGKPIEPSLFTNSKQMTDVICKEVILLKENAR